MRRAPFRLAVVTTHPIQYQTPLFRALAQRPELDVTVYFCSTTGLHTAYDPHFGALRWDIPLLEGYRSVFLSRRPKGWTGTFCPDLSGRISRRRHDGVMLFGWRDPSYALALATGVVKRVPILLLTDTNALDARNTARRRLRNAALSVLFRRVSGFLTIGTMNRRFYEMVGVPARRMVSFPYSVDNTRFFRSAAALEGSRASLRAELGLPTTLPVVLFAGRFMEVKRLPDLLDAYAGVADRAALLLAGDGPIRAALEARSRALGLKHVRFAGFQNQTALPRCYAAADLLVLPSSSEAWGLVVNEAMCFGLPVIVSDRVGAGPDLVTSGVNGLVFPAGDVAALRACLERLVGDELLRGRMGRASLARIRGWCYDVAIDNLIAYLPGLKKTAVSVTPDEVQ
jgi:glycosyltransferase involved in cell wall biosynthesis